MSKVDLSLTIKQVSRLAREFDFLRKEVISKIDSKVLSHEALGAVDLLDSVHHELMALVDGRPQPFHLEERFLKEEARYGTLERWAQCCSENCEFKALIGHQELNATELKQLYKWIQSVLQFHKIKP